MTSWTQLGKDNVIFGGDFNFAEGGKMSPKPGCGQDLYVPDSSYYTLYSPFRAVHTPVYTRYACIYIVYTQYIHLTHL